MGVETWSSAAWVELATAWLDERLADAGIERTGPAEQPRVRPWSTQLTAPTTVGTVWLKAVNPPNAFEAGLYDVLHELVPHRVLAPIATDAERGWMLLPDGGRTIADRDLADDDLVKVLTEVIPRYGLLQRDLAPHVDRMLAAGVTDMRPTVMPQRFDEALAVVGDLPAVAAKSGEFADWCARLAVSPVPPSLDHNDLHANNILLADLADPDAVRFYDWGDAVIAHPFAAMFVPLKVLADILGKQTTGVLRVRDAYLEVFADLGSHAELAAELDLACRVAKVARTLVWARAVAVSPGEWADAPRETLMSLLAESYF
ncbi:Phosphotransferase enzyme family protein [Actinokineospora alba]|uniref:Phosphotransferase enzyme family protein n=1 Tax=Actinokineospora alba TaxID=504798 RepID=A0A1H0PKL9_9PSEU|nr:phosphotransferase [Actinokineospora alba]TDP65839.1 phosphotransferase family enzyme [Actinokineospora alba]SDI63986.1 Phosphotransferase enzyme family protein [Actinokineospora alba]SDP05544.1 Phosphotransferase enzyme family protein [Actinokineospora alba]